MKVSKALAAPPDFLFDKVLESSLYDVKEQTGHAAPSLNLLSGFSYTKRFSNHQSGKITFDKITRPLLYSFTTTTENNSFSTSWAFEKVNEKYTKVIVSEKRTSNTGRQWMNDIIMSFVMHHVKRKRILNIFSGLERQYKS